MITDARSSVYTLVSFPQCRYPFRAQLGLVQTGTGCNDLDAEKSGRAPHSNRLNRVLRFLDPESLTDVCIHAFVPACSLSHIQAPLQEAS